jgi:hypothetical protein
VPLDRRVQVAPPSVVRRIVPYSPTAITVLVFKTAVARSVFPWGSGFCQYQPDCAAAASVSTDPILSRPRPRIRTLFSMGPL